MSDFNKLIGRAIEAAKEEGLLDKQPDNINRLLPDASSSPLDLDKLKKVAAKVLSEEVTTENIKVGIQPNNQKSASSEKDVVDIQSEVEKAKLVVEEQMKFLEQWFDQNYSESKKDRVQYWLLKIPAIICTVSVTALEAFDYGEAIIILGAVASFCVAVDAVFPRGQLHNVHRKAANEIRRLQHDVLTK